MAVSLTCCTAGPPGLRRLLTGGKVQELLVQRARLSADAVEWSTLERRQAPEEIESCVVRLNGLLHLHGYSPLAILDWRMADQRATRSDRALMTQTLSVSARGGCQADSYVRHCCDASPPARARFTLRGHTIAATLFFDTDAGS